jgi:hypothetical protein
MRTLVALGTIMASLSAPAVAAQVEWRGAVCVTTANTVCLADGWAVGDCMTLRFLPPNIGTNGPSTRLNFGGQFGASQYTLDSGTLVGATFKPVRETVSGRFGFQATTPMRLSSLLPATITATTSTISLVAIIQDTDGTSGCTLGVRGAATLKP